MATTITVLPVGLHPPAAYPMAPTQVPAGTGQVRLTFAATDWPTSPPGGAVLTYSVSISRDNGQTWQPLHGASAVAGTHPLTGLAPTGPDVGITFDPPADNSTQIQATFTLSLALTTSLQVLIG